MKIITKKQQKKIDNMNIKKLVFALTVKTDYKYSLSEAQDKAEAIYWCDDIIYHD